MEFGLSEDQRMLQDSIGGAMAAAASLDNVRAVASGDAKAASALNEAFDALGTAALLIPESAGGLGMGLLDSALVAEALGSHVVPVSFIAHQMGVAGILACTDANKRQALLQAVSSGDMRLGAAVTEAVAKREGAGVTHDSGKLSGTALFVLGAKTATHLIVSDLDGALYLAETPAAITPLISIDKTCDTAEVVFDQHKAEALTGANASDAIRVGRTLLAANTLGACQSMLDKAVAYANERKQFGRVIGSFQAVKHMCAEMVAKLEPSRALVWQAAHAVDTGDAEADVMVCLAKAHLDDVGTFVARTSTEVHGGMGFTDLVGLHYWFKRVGLNRQLLGGPELVREEAAKLQGW